MTDQSTEALYALVREARDIVPHADVPSRWRTDWCARADALLASVAVEARVASDEEQQR